MKKEINTNAKLTNLQQTRMKNGFTRHFVAMKLGVCDCYFGKIERGWFPLSITKIKTLAALYNVPDEAIFHEAVQALEYKKMRDEVVV